MITNQNTKPSYRLYFLIIQICLYFAGIGFSAGGGNFPGQEQNDFLPYKVIFILLPYLSLAYLAVIRPIAIANILAKLLQANKYFLIYCLLALVFLPFAVDWSYSLTRLAYMLFEAFGLITILAQYVLYGYQSDFRNLEKTINAISFFILLFPLSVFVINGFSFTDFRSALENLYLIHPNILAAFYGHFCLWHALHLLFSAKKKKANLIYFFLFCFAEYLLFSRTAIIGLIAIFSLLPLLRFSITKSSKSLIAFLFVISFYLIGLSVVLIGAIPSSDIASVFLRDDTIDSIITFTNRTILWDQLIGNINSTTLLTGYGYSVIDPDFGIDMGTGILYGAHNAYLSVLLGSGGFALLAVLVYLFKNLIKLYKQTIPPEIHYAVLSSYLLFFITGCFSEEIGISFSVTFAYLFFMSNILLTNRS
jgi:hypothetical protein